MDIKEKGVSEGGVARHPWEISRLGFMLDAIKKSFPTDPPASILDIGSGDAFIIDSLSEYYPAAQLAGVDINLPEPLAREKYTVHTSLETVPERNFALVTMFDVIEHIENDAGFIKDVAERFMGSDSLLFITVPMHRFLFSKHDRWLNHYRRYSSESLHNLAGDCSMEIIAQGQFFFSLFIVRAVQKFLLPAGRSKGVGSWHGGRFLTSAITCLLDFDRRFFSFLPGLSGYLVLRSKRGKAPIRPA
jgi:hypothetical protein